jgi:energy-coupling factor transporter ATP-binding protein EcfA2
VNIPEWPFPGSRWWKFDFHNHTPKSTDYGKARADEASLKARTTEEWLLDYMRAGIDCVAVTDHNSGAWIDELKSTLATMERTKPNGYRPLFLFPGVELSLGRCHYLALFDPHADQSKIQGLIGFSRYRGTQGASDGSCEASISDIAAEVARLGGLFIPAHADATTGIFTELRGNDLRPVLQCENIIAVEMTNPASAMPSLYTECKLRWTRILGSDSHHPDSGPEGGTKFPGSHYTWVKMAKPSLEALRLALIDGEDVSIRRSDDSRPGFRPFDTPEDLIEGIKIHDARFMGRGQPQVFQFSPWLNALVGGRGSGKSTVIHLLRLAMQREDELERFEKSSLLRDFQRFRLLSRQRDDEGALRADTKLEVIYRHQGVRYLISWSDNGDVLSVEEWCEDIDSWLTASSQEVKERFPVRIFSQGQIAALAGERSEALMDLVNQAVGFNEWKSRWDEKERAFFTLRNRSRELAGKLTAKDRIVGQLEDVRRKLKRFEDAEHAKVLKTYRVRKGQAREVEQVAEVTNEIVEKIRAIAAECVTAEIPADAFDPTDELGQEAKAAIQKIHAAIAEAAVSLDKVADDLSAVEELTTTSLSLGSWQADVDATEAAFDTLVEDLKSQGVNDPSEYGRLVKDRQRLEEELAAMELLTKQAEELKAERAVMLTDLLTLRREISKKRSDFLTEILATNAYVRIELQPYGRDPRAIEDSIRDLLGIKEDTPPFEQDIYREGDGEAKPSQGVVFDLLYDLPESGVAEAMESRIASLKKGLIRAAKGGEYDKIGSKLRTRLQKTTEQRAEFLDRILTWFPEDGLKVTYSPGSDGGDFRPIQQGSAGQRAAAMLAFLLAYGSEPIIVDQPEDDLDNYLITRLVVNQIRENKARRQIICVTHNPNIVVNGDAEMVHALDFKSSQCKITYKGSLQDHDVREEVCRVMEGGRDAFEQRYRRIGHGGRHV